VTAWGLHLEAVQVLVVLEVVCDPAVPPAVHLLSRSYGRTASQLAAAGWEPGVPVVRSWGTAWPVTAGQQHP
jgi:hypothetical protein